VRVSRRRVAVIVLVALVVLVLPVGVLAMGDRQLDQARQDLLIRATGLDLAPADAVAELFTADGVLARRLAVEPGDVELTELPDGSWCVQVTVRRLLSATRVWMSLPRDGTALQPVSTC
jgi:hypothetical protein